MSFDMPPASAGFPARGRWLIDHLSAGLEITENQAAGIVGNIGFESTGLTVLHEVGQPAGEGGYGWGQWTGPRRRQFFAWCEAQHLSYFSDEGNYGFLLHELKGDYAYVVRDLRQKATLEDCVFLVGRLYETPEGTTATHLPGYDGRLSRAKEALAGASAGAQEGGEAVGAGSAPSTPQSAPAVSPAPSSAEPDDDSADQMNADEVRDIEGGGT